MNRLFLSKRPPVLFLWGLFAAVAPIGSLLLSGFPKPETPAGADHDLRLAGIFRIAAVSVLEKSRQRAGMEARLDNLGRFAIMDLPFLAPGTKPQGARKGRPYELRRANLRAALQSGLAGGKGVRPD